MCAAELPQIEALVNAFGDAVNIAIIVPTHGVKSPPKEMLPHFGKPKHRYDVLLDDGSGPKGDTVGKACHAGTGQWYLIDKAGIVRAAGQQELEKAAEELSKATGRKPVKLPELRGFPGNMPGAGNAPGGPGTAKKQKADGKGGEGASAEPKKPAAETGKGKDAAAADFGAKAPGSAH
jgi:hypothetical protein